MKQFRSRRNPCGLRWSGLLTVMLLLVVVPPGVGCGSGPDDDDGAGDASDTPEVDDSIEESTDESVAPPAETGEHQLTIDLQEGFDGAAVEVLVDGAVVYAEDEVTTSPLLGLADTVVITTASPTAVIEIRIDESGPHRFDVDRADGAFVGISAGADQPTLIQSDDPFGYG